MTRRRIAAVVVAIALVVLGAWAITYALWAGDADEPRVEQPQSA